ncbi:MAG: hypothetical protein WBD36_13985 [Bacteroidota bacterium]
MTESNTQGPEEQSGLHLLDYLDFLVKRKELFFLVFFSSFVLSYLGIYFLVQEQFEATAVIVPRSDDETNLASGLLRSVKGLPFGIGAKSAGTETDFYKTIIYSRTMMEDVIRKFELWKIYGLDTSDVAYKEKAIKRLRGEVNTRETEESAFAITVSAVTRQMAADITNYIVRAMNTRIIELKSSSSGENRKFLEKRLGDISEQLRVAEDSLRAYQERTGLLDAKVQLQGILTANTNLEVEFAAKQLQRGILERVFDKESPQLKEIEIQIDEYRKKLEQMRSQGNPGSPLLALNKLPKTAVEFLRRYREVEINNLVLQYVVPLYEQAKIEEKKDLPILQIIDYAVPPAKKSWPPRTLFAFVGACSITLFVFVVLLFRNVTNNISDRRIRVLIDEARHWTWRRGRKH